MLKNKIIIIHFQPLEFYPPIQNLLSVLNKSEIKKDILVISTTQTKYKTYNLNGNLITILRITTHSSNRIVRLFKHFYFYVLSFYKLVRFMPDTVLYFESISAFPAILYKLIFKKNRILVHYHEYTTKEEYRKGMRLVKWNHILEKNNYMKFSWISHTNNKRIQLFREDNFGISEVVLHAMPNFPLSNWNYFSLPLMLRHKPIVQLVYVGALSLEDTYIFELIDFIKDKSEKYALEIFSIHFPEELKKIIEQGKLSHIKYSGSLEYNLIPKALQDKDIGLILYKGNTPNYVYNAPNKLFEYLNCGLDVWFPKEMIGCYEYISEENPKVIMLDFLNIEYSLQEYFYTQPRIQKSKRYVAEYATRELVQFLKC